MAKAVHELERLQKYYPDLEWKFSDKPDEWLFKSKGKWHTKTFPHSKIDDCFHCGRRTNLFRYGLSSYGFHQRLKDQRQIKSWYVDAHLCMGCMNTYRALFNKCQKADELLSTVMKIERIYKDARTKNNA